jgi:hypothetical protein
LKGVDGKTANQDRALNEGRKSASVAQGVPAAAVEGRGWKDRE